MVRRCKFQFYFKGFGGFQLAKYADPYKYVINSRSEFSLPDDSVGKNVIIFGVDMGSSY